MHNQEQQGDIVPQHYAGEIYDKIANPLDAIKAIGQSIAQSGLFGCTKQEQGEILAMQCLAERKPPLELAKTYHLIDGKLAMKADAMLARFQEMGGRVDWKIRTDKCVTAIFSMNGSTAEIVATMDEYIANGVAIGKDGKSIKDNWKKWPKRMLTARAISEGVRLIGPQVCFGTYTPEELDTNDNVTKTLQVIEEDPVQSLISLLAERNITIAVAEQVLLRTNNIQPGQMINDIDPAIARKIVKRPDGFILSCQQQN